jgi:hypothetical protein
MSTLEKVQEIARRYREVAVKYQHAMKPAAINAAWRSLVKDEPDLAPYADEFVRAVEGR